MRTGPFLLVCLIVGGLVFAAALALGNDYYFFAGYVVLQYIVLATAWNILGGYCGYVNFGSAAFFALGAYSTVAIHRLGPLPIPVLVAIGGVVSGFVGFGMGYLTLRLRGAFFAIATLALAVVLETLIVNWDFVGGSRGAYIVRPQSIAPFGSYIRYLFLIMMLIAVGSITIARLIERSRLGFGFATIRDDEQAAEASGVPTLRLKLIATTISGALMGCAGAPFPYYIGYLQPSSAFGLDYAVNSIAMPLIGGTTSWVGPLIGAILLGSLQQIATVTISSAVNLLIVGFLLVGFVIVAPNGIIGLVQKYIRHRPDRADRPPPRQRRCAGSRTMSGLLEVNNLGKRFGGFVALESIVLSVRPGERIGLIGPNGSGKSTLVNCICGTLRNESGSVNFDGRLLDGATAHQRTRRGLSRTFQLPRPFASLSVADNLRVPLLYTVAARSGSHRSTADLEARCIDLLREVGLDKKAKRLPRELTQVEMRKLELARAMAAEPKLLIADESMAGLTHSEVEEILALLRRLNERGVTIILIEHIMRAVMSFSQRLVVLVSGRKIADGDPEVVVRDPEVERAYLGQ